MYLPWNNFIQYSQSYAEFKIKNFGEIIGNRLFPLNDCFFLLWLSRPLGFKRRKKNNRLHYSYRWELTLTFYSGYWLTFSNIRHLTFVPRGLERILLPPTISSIDFPESQLLWPWHSTSHLGGFLEFPCVWFHYPK